MEEELMALGTMNHLALTLRNLRVSEAAFYAPVLEFLGYAKVEDSPEMTLWFSDASFCSINLSQAKPDLAGVTHQRYAPGFHHFAFNADSRKEVDDLHKLLRNISATVIDTPAEYEYVRGYYAVYFADPDGMKFELVHIPPEAFAS
jgi:catechol 2,3-dioxygenase-like lactoylglutathione lyase family enzyme